MKWALIIIGAVAAVALLITLVGSVIGRDHVASTRAIVPAPPDSVYAAITNAGEHPSWRKNLKSVEMLEPRDGHPRWREVSSFGPMTIELLERVPNQKVVGKVEDDGQAFGGTWTYEIAAAPDGKGSVVTITERGFVNNPLFRFLSRFVFGYYGAQEDYLRALGSRFGAPAVTVTRV
jgi:uncharacterized protein YndB with AHSA1/START domain